ncbi:helix-turn-helix transcriptional regulator [Candidatus Woesebacteria bacterium]|nr:MAG: helix-turn-helix transcriptional regulator [Candidatus Woesebacteria bacterium]
MGKVNKSFPINEKEKEEVQQKFGKRLAELRSGKFTQEKFAFEVGVDRTYISYIERGEKNPSLYVLARMAKALKISLSELVSF